MGCYSTSWTTSYMASGLQGPSPNVFMEVGIRYLLIKEDIYRLPDIGGHAKEWGTRNLLGFHVYIKGTHALGKGTIS